MRWILFFLGAVLVLVGGMVSIYYDYWLGTIMAFAGVFVVVRAMTTRRR